MSSYPVNEEIDDLIIYLDSQLDHETPPDIKLSRKEIDLITAALEAFREEDNIG